MNALRSLLSYQGAPYLWERSGSAPAYRYVPATSIRSRRLPSEIRTAIQAEFEEQCADLDTRDCRGRQDHVRLRQGNDVVARGPAFGRRVDSAFGRSSPEGRVGQQAAATHTERCLARRLHCRRAHQALQATLGRAAQGMTFDTESETCSAGAWALPPSTAAPGSDEGWG